MQYVRGVSYDDLRPSPEPQDDEQGEAAEAQGEADSEHGRPGHSWREMVTYPSWPRFWLPWGSMSFDPADLPLDDVGLRALGVIAVQAARVEWQLAGLRSIVDPSLTHQQHVRQGRPREHVRVIRAHLRANESWAGPGPTTETIWWAEEAERLLVERGNILHLGWLMGDGDVVPGEAVTGLHHKTGAQRTLHQADLDDLGHRLGVHAAAGFVYWLFAMQDLIAAPDDPWISLQDDGGSMDAAPDDVAGPSE